MSFVKPDGFQYLYRPDPSSSLKGALKSLNPLKVVFRIEKGKFSSAELARSIKKVLDGIKERKIKPRKMLVGSKDMSTGIAKKKYIYVLAHEEIKNKVMKTLAMMIMDDEPENDGEDLSLLDALTINEMNVAGWIEPKNSFMFFVDKKMYESFLLLAGVGIKDEGTDDELFEDDD